ncbi:PTS ascorbate transporter subunit IIC [Lysinibacillus mangiferihumi]|uniref:Ascorbate-specific PTS system EIIC component n=1 Tax=Lysinibacillus mangiferihumi TaxID=1130819 RepID=A0A4U2Z0Y4_9BACI|nr:PTS ascorbate transporter subunit IIC [Lysinibacillus mangiferihumi]TKI67669.1 PTS ascorbate transporter subunit IIC [Lysinibacillus mangiferihumi]
MEVLEFIIQLLTTPAIILGLVALIGLLIQRKVFGDVVKGTFKTILGILILSAGAGIIVDFITPFSEMFTQAFNLTGVVPFDEAVIGALSENVTEIARNSSLILAFGFVVNIILARFSSFKYIYLTGHMLWIMSGALAWAFYDLGYSTTEAVLWGSLIQGLILVLFPALAQPIMRKVIGNNDIAYGHLTTSGVVLSAYIGKIFGNASKDSEKVKMPKGLEMFKDTAISISAVMLILYLITTFVAGPEFVSTLSGEQNWLVYSIIQAFGFTAGVLVLLQGVRMFLGEIVPAFRGVAIKLVPGAKPALDVPVIFGFAPTALMIGFVFSVLGMIIGMFVSKAFGTVIPLPSIIGGFFTGGAAGIFGNALGGRRGAMISGVVYGLVLTIPVALFYPLFGLEVYGISGVALLVPDAIIVLTLLKIFSSLNIIPVVVILAILGVLATGFINKKRKKKRNLLK